MLKIIAMALVLTGCSTPHDYKQLSYQEAEYGLQSFDDKHTGNTCFIYKDSDTFGFSCVKK